MDLHPRSPVSASWKSSNPSPPLIKGELHLYLCSSLEEVRQWGRTGSCCHRDISDLPGTDQAREQPLIHRLESPSSQNTLAGAVRRCWRVPVLKLTSTWSPETEYIKGSSPSTEFLFHVGKRGLGAPHKYKKATNKDFLILRALIHKSSKLKGKSLEGTPACLEF